VKLNAQPYKTQLGSKMIKDKRTTWVGYGCGQPRKGRHMKEKCLENNVKHKNEQVQIKPKFSFSSFFVIFN
jgi:hypothetical protein